MRRALIIVLVATGCARVPPPQTVFVELSASGGQCMATVDGRSLPNPGLTSGAERDPVFQQFARRRVLILSNGDVPYRCIGGLIYAMQVARAARINFRSLEQASVPNAR